MQLFSRVMPASCFPCRLATGESLADQGPPPIHHHDGREEDIEVGPNLAQVSVLIGGRYVVPDGGDPKKTQDGGGSHRTLQAIEGIGNQVGKGTHAHPREESGQGTRSARPQHPGSARILFIQQLRKHLRESAPVGKGNREHGRKW